MPYSRATRSEIVARVRDDIDARMPGADSRVRRSVLEVLALIIAGVADGVYGLIDYIWRQIFPDSAEAPQLARWAAIWGKTRKAASFATGVISISGSDGAAVPVGATLITTDGREFVASAPVTIVGGSAALPVSAATAGLSGNCRAAQPVTFASPVAGINATAVVAPAGIFGGADEEDDEALRARVLDRIRNPPHGGNISDYRQWAIEVAGVTRAWVYAGELGIGTITLRFVIDGRADIIPSPAEIAAVQAYIDALRPVTAALNVVAPVAVPLNFNIRITPRNPAVEAAIREELTDLLRREAQPGGPILKSHIDEAISLAAGEYDHQLIIPSGDARHGTGQIAVIGAIEFIT